MNPNLFSSFVFIFSTALAFASAAYDPPMKPEQYPKMDCAPTSCGNVKNITYPFWVEKQQPSHCGFPAFKLRCNDQTPILRTSSADYLVREIFYENNSLALVNSAYVSNPCPVPHSNLSFSLTPFNVRSASRDLVFLFNCSPESNFYRVGCGANDTFACWGDELGSFVNCERVIMPVVDYSNGGNVTDYARILGGGFVVEWTAPDCAECRESNGQCGYNNLNDNFMCICPDRAHWRSCQPDPWRCDGVEFPPNQNTLPDSCTGQRGDVGILYPFFLNTVLPCKGNYKIRCDYETNGSKPMIKFDGREYVVKEILYKEKLLIVQDLVLGDYLLGRHCGFLFNFTNPIPNFSFPTDLPLQSPSKPFTDYEWEIDTFYRFFFHKFDDPHCIVYNLYYWESGMNQWIVLISQPTAQ